MDVAEEPNNTVAVYRSPYSDPPVSEVADFTVLTTLVRPVAVLSMDAVEHGAQDTATSVNYHSMKV